MLSCYTYLLSVTGADYSYVYECLDRINDAWKRTNLRLAADLSKDGADAYVEMCSLFKSKGRRAAHCLAIEMLAVGSITYFVCFLIP